MRRRTIWSRILKSKTPDCAGAFALRDTSPSKRVSIFATAHRRRSHGTGAGTVVLLRWIRRAAFVGPAARARPCGHAFLMLRFLAGGSARTDGSVIGHAGRGLALSRRNERRAEERRSDKSRDCKFGSHQKCLPKDYRMPRCIGRALRKSYVRTVADVWKVTERRTSGKRRSNETAIPTLPRMSKIFLAIIITAIGTLIGLFVFAAFTL
jgi:hypothetical protein